MFVEVRDGLIINKDRIDFVTYNPDDENTSYMVCVNSRLFSFTKDEYDNLEIDPTA